MLLAIDGSYIQYHSIFRAIREWSSKNRLESQSYLTPREDGTKTNLLNSDTFKSELYNSFLHTCYVIPEIIESNFRQYSGYDIKGYADIVFCADDFTSNGFRKLLYEDYKGGRIEARAKNPYDLYKVKQYFKILFDQTDIWNRCGYKYAFVDGAEGDDIIYRLMKKCEKDYDIRVIISSDRDLLQIPDVFQFDLNDKVIKREGKQGPLSTKEFLLQKILIGDKSDNIPQVFPRVGPVKAENMVKDGTLKLRLLEDASALERFKLNMQLMDMSKMPEELSKKIDSVLDEILCGVKKESIDFDSVLENMSQLPTV